MWATMQDVAAVSSDHETPSPPEIGARERIVEQLSEALSALMSHYGVELEEIGICAAPAAETSTARQVAAVIGFAGAHVGGTLVLQAPCEIIAACLPLSDLQRRGDAAIGDWMGELSNQLLGRLKSKVGRFGVDFLLTPPTHLMGNALQVWPFAIERTVWLSARTPEGGALVGMFDLQLGPGLVLTEPAPEDEDDAFGEGDMMLLL